MNSDLLRRLDAWLSQNRAEFYRTLSPGVAVQALAQWEREAMAAPSAGKAPADWFRVEYPSLEKWLEVLVTALEEGRAYTLDEPNARPPAPFGLSEPEVQKRLCPGYPGEEQDLGDLWV